jgi:16S rRNA G527 N7-methylase RsmG
VPDDSQLLAALDVVRRRGGIGESSLESAVAHADRFVAALPRSLPDHPIRLIDLGSGGGLPALVIAWRRADLTVTMVERRATRADILRRAVTALCLTGHTEVVADDVRTVASARARAFDVVTARSFAGPSITVGFASVLLVSGGVLLVSEPPDASDHDRWTAGLLEKFDMDNAGLVDGIRLLRRR